MKNKILVGLTVLGIASLIYTTVLLFTNQDGIYNIRILVLLGILGLLVTLFDIGLSSTLKAVKQRISNNDFSLQSNPTCDLYKVL